MSARVPDGPSGHWLWGVLPEVRRDVLSFLDRCFRTYGDVVRYRLGPMTSHLIVHPEGVKHILQENVKNYTKAHFSYALVRRIIGNGLVTSEGAFWLRQRRLAQPAFHRERIARMTGAMITAAEELVARWEEHAAAGTPVPVAPEMMALTLRVVVDALFGTRVGELSRQVGAAFSVLNEDTTTRFREMKILPPVLPTARDRRFRAAIRTLDAVVQQIVSERRRAQDAAERADLLSMLMAARDEDTGEGMSDQQLRDEILTLLLAGHETTATALSWAFVLLHQHPHTAALLEQELDDRLGDRPLTAEAVTQLSWPRMIIEETLRLYPPVYIWSRRAVQADEVCGYRIPAGASIDISPWLTHRHPAFWPEPERFDPERFLPGAASHRPRFAYLPFSGGPRQCIGNTFALVEAQIILATVARRFRLRAAPHADTRPDPLITLRPRGELPMIVERRQRT